MGIRIVSSDAVLNGIKLNPTLEQELTQNVSVIMTTPQGTVPLDRGFGLPMTYKDAPQNIALIRQEAELSMALQTYEPRVVLNNSTARTDEDGNIVFEPEVEYGG